MVKADLTRDYYGDLEILPTADTAEIKKQFKKLALTYHPDRNPGRESEVTAKFQRIQSAHEVLTDTTERAKYDANRIRAPGGLRNLYAGGTASGMKGNPWSNVSSQFPTPPKPPTARHRQPPPPSSGARRYEKFATPSTSAYQAAQEGPRARQDTYEAWENLKHRERAEPGPSKTSRAPPQPPPRNTPQYGRPESKTRAQPQASSKYQANFDEYREPDSAHRRSQSSNASNRKGFMPHTPGGDEPPAPMGAYFTNHKATAPPDPPPRKPPPFSTTSTSNVGPDPLRQFRERDRPPMEPRLSTPYATHGGEKFNLFDSPNINRSKSTRERNDRFDNESVPRTGSDSNMNSPHRSRSFAQRSSAQTKPADEKAFQESSSSEELPRMNGSGSANRSNGSAPRRTPQASDAAQQPANTRKQSKISQMRQWMSENPGQEPPPDGFPPDGPPLRSGHAGTTTNGTNGTTTQPSMYANPDSFSSFKSDNMTANSFSLKHSAVPRVMPQNESISQKERERIKLSPLKSDTLLFGAKVSAKFPSGIVAASENLNAFEAKQRDFIDRLLSNKRTHSWSQKSPDGSTSVPQSESRSKGSPPSQRDKWNCYRESTELCSPSKKPKGIHGYSHFGPLHARAFWKHKEGLQNSANSGYNTRFSFNLKDDTFIPTQPQSNGFSSSAENISTKFTPEDWAGKFEAGADYFKPAPSSKPGSGPSVRPRAQSTSRSRGRSPPKVRTTVDPMFMPPHAGQETPIESPGGTKFSPEEWAETFAPQTFMPPPNPSIPPRPQAYKKRTNPNIRPTMGGHAAVVDEGDTSDEKPLFNEPKAASPQSISPDPMDVDTPPVSHTIPLFAPKNDEKLKLNVDPLKRPAATSASQSPTDEEDLKVNFEDLKIQDILTSPDLPLPPSPPIVPQAADSELPSRQAYEDYLKRYEDYMISWDLVNTKFLLHVVARRNQNDNLLSRRWTDEKSTEVYRLGLKEDSTVLKKWAELTEKHEKVVKGYVILKERMKSRVEREEVKQADKEKTPRTRKKTH